MKEKIPVKDLVCSICGNVVRIVDGKPLCNNAPHAEVAFAVRRPIIHTRKLNPKK